MDFLIQTAWYSIELHGHAMAFRETASVLQGTPWHSMEFYNIPWNSMDLQGNSMEFHGIPWNSINTSWNSVELHGIPWNSMDTQRNSMAFHGTPWILHGTPRHSIELVPWNSIDFHRFPWNSILWRYFTRGLVANCSLVSVPLSTVTTFLQLCVMR